MGKLEAKGSSTSLPSAGKNPPNGGGGDGGGGDNNNQSLIDGLLKVLPKAGALWTLELRRKWLQTAAANFDYAYRAADGDERSIRVTIE